MTNFLEKQLKRNREFIRSALGQKGFTLTELLVVVIIASVIVSSLMTLVVQLMSTEQRESSRTETEREMQLAINYIAADLRQAIYVYDGTQHPHPNSNSEPSYLEYLPATFSDAANNYRPVLAFWKTKPIPNIETSGLPAFNANSTGGGGCEDLVTGPANNPNLLRFNECNNLWLTRQNYTLVAYLQIPNYTDDKLNNAAPRNADERWKGKSRIVRYELDKYSDLANLTRNPGYVDPAELSNSEGFVAWPFESSAANAENCQDTGCGIVGTVTQLPNGQPATLVDFVDFPNAASPRGDEPDNCDDLNTTGGTYFMSPREDAVNSPKPAFFVCIRDTRATDANGIPIGDARVGEIQDIVVFLRGNAQGRGSTSADSFLPTLQTRITMRGVIDRVIR